MAEFARVVNLDALRDVKAALQSFADDATVALSEATSDAQRGLWYIANDCKAHWQRELKKRTDKLQQAKAELFKKQLESNDTRTSAVVERKNVARWEAAVAQAEEKLRRIKHWSHAMEREFMLFKAGVQGLSNIVAADLPAATARIDRMIASLQAYIHLQAPSGAALKSITSPQDDQEPPAATDSAHATPPPDKGASP
jgi:glutamine synthetase adenylyltransferase